MIQTDITGVYALEANGTFNINGHEWQIRTKGKRQYIIDNTEDKYISGIFQVKGFEDEFCSFDYVGGYYIMSTDSHSIYIQFVNPKIN